jgi:hypothetical protein
MKRLIALSAVLAIVALPAVAQTSDLPGTTSVTPEVRAAPDAGTTSAISGGDLDAAIAAMRDNRANANTLGDLAAVTEVRFVPLEPLAGARKPELDAALEETKDDQTGLQAAIKANPALSAKLEEESVDISTVVAGRIEADGSVTLYTQ